MLSRDQPAATRPRSSGNPASQGYTGFSDGSGGELREVLLLFVIAALASIYFVRQSRNASGNSRAPFSLSAPIEYRYWHQHGSAGTGTGQIGSGDEWKPAQGIEVFKNFIILHLDDGLDRMVEREDLRWFDWRRTGLDGASGRATPKGPSLSH